MTFKAHTADSLKKKLDEFTDAGKRLPNTHGIKLLLIKVGLLKNKCSKCSITKWQGEKISLHLDHIDGNPRNNSILNLRILCPNCHSQTETYCGKNTTRKKNENHCIDCNKKLSASWSTRCRSCFGKQRQQETKIEWPSNEKLIQLIKNHTMEAIAKKLSVSSNAIRKHCKNHGIDYQKIKYFECFLNHLDIGRY
jgi:hypothetical protein